MIRLTSVLRDRQERNQSYLTMTILGTNCRDGRIDYLESVFEKLDEQLVGRLRAAFPIWGAHFNFSSDLNRRCGCGLHRLG
jgi:hypothetical protein